MQSDNKKVRPAIISDSNYTIRCINPTSINPTSKIAIKHKHPLETLITQNSKQQPFTIQQQTAYTLLRSAASSGKACRNWEGRRRRAWRPSWSTCGTRPPRPARPRRTRTPRSPWTSRPPASLAGGSRWPWGWQIGVVRRVAGKTASPGRGLGFPATILGERTARATMMV